MSIVVYKASAGSGKTYTLVYEYIKYLFLAQLNYIEGNGNWLKNAHRRTLAVTFTNKSTAEMKERIINALFMLSSSSSLSDYVDRLLHLDEFKDNIKFDEQRIKTISFKLLSDILQDFSGFRVQTIDGFFQQIVRTFAYELNINNQYQVELDTQQILELAVDSMLASLDKPEKKILLEWLTQYANDKVDSQKGWNPRSDLLSLSNLLLSEDYISKQSDFNISIDSLLILRPKLKDIVTKFEDKLSKLCNEGARLCEKIEQEKIINSNIIKAFNAKKIINNKFELSNTFLKSAGSNDLACWCLKKAQVAANQSTVDDLYKVANEIAVMCGAIGSSVSVDFIKYNTSKIILSNLYIVGILSELSSHMKEICLIKNAMIISSTAEFLKTIIGNSDTPFIYEKVGIQTDHYMIDEFQDTSNMQWKNFIPLLDEVVSVENESMLVGDVKQSIYRWRNGDWNILHSGVASRFNSNVVEKKLDSNFRSCGEVVNFTNYMFDKLPAMLNAELNNRITIDFQKVYKDSNQHISPSKSGAGYVKCNFISVDKNSIWADDSLSILSSDIKNAFELGESVSYKNMAVLVRTSKEAKLVANKMLEENIPFYSVDTLLLGNNSVIKFLIATIRYISQPYESLNRAKFFVQFNETINGKEQSEVDLEYILRGDFSSGKDYINWEKRVFSTIQWDVDVELISEEFKKLKNYPLVRMLQTIESLFNISNLPNRDSNTFFIQSFYDKIQEFIASNGSDIKQFLKYWDEKCTTLSMPISEDFDGVRIMTVYKSKGLEFDFVFIPFCDWKMQISDLNNYMLFKTDNNVMPEIDELSLVPVNTKSSKSMLNSIFKDQVYKEYENSILDILNLLYVATTRAKSQLYINFEDSIDDNKDDQLKKIQLSNLVKNILDSFADIKSEVSADESVTFFEIGSFESYIVPQSIVSSTQSINTDNYNVANIDVVGKRNRFKYRLSEDFMADGDTNSHSYKARMEGILLHSIMSKMINVNDIDRVIKECVLLGDIEEKEKLCYREKIDEIFLNEEVRTWFSDEYRVLNEVDIYNPNNNHHYRPDRVVINEEKKSAIVIDYKFGDITSSLMKKYERQVNDYVLLLTDMGYKTIGKILQAKTKPVRIINVTNLYNEI